LREHSGCAESLVSCSHAAWGRAGALLLHFLARCEHRERLALEVVTQTKLTSAGTKCLRPAADMGRAVQPIVPTLVVDPSLAVGRGRVLAA
jgi:hypothetical protein